MTQPTAESPAVRTDDCNPTAPGWRSWLSLPALLAVHLGIQFLTRRAIVYQHFTSDPVLQQPGSWLHYMNHHLVQMVLALLLIALITRGRPGGAGLNLRNAAESWRLLTRGFFPILLISLLLGHALTPMLQGVPPERFAGEIRTLDLLGTLVFAWILVGVSEEIVFRGFFQTAAARYWRGVTRLAGVNVPVAGVIAAVIFTIAHVSLRTWSADPRQLLLAFVLGIFYAVAYHRTGSLLAPIIAHNAVDGGIVTVEWLVASCMAG